MFAAAATVMVTAVAVSLHPTTQIRLRLWVYDEFQMGFLLPLFVIDYRIVSFWSLLAENRKP
jgi:hypothetical protein